MPPAMRVSVNQAEHLTVRIRALQHGRDLFDQRVDSARVGRTLPVCLIRHAHRLARAVRAVAHAVADDAGQRHVAFARRVRAARDLGEHLHGGRDDHVGHGAGDAAHRVENAFRLLGVESDDDAVHGSDERAEIGRVRFRVEEHARNVLLRIVRIA